MKHLVLIIHAGLKQSTADELRKLEIVDEFTFTNIEGHGVQSEGLANLSDRDKVVGYIPQLRVDIILEDSKVESVLAIFNTGENLEHKQNMFWVTNIESMGRF